MWKSDRYGEEGRGIGADDDGDERRAMMRLIFVNMPLLVRSIVTTSRDRILKNAG